MLRNFTAAAVVTMLFAVAGPAVAQMPRQSAEVPGTAIGPSLPQSNPSLPQINQTPLPAQRLPQAVQPSAGQAGSYVSNGMGGYNGTGRNAGSGWRPDGMGNLIGTGNNAGHRCAANNGGYACK